MGPYLRSRVAKYTSYSIARSIPVLIISKEISTPFSCLRLRECCRPMKWSRKCRRGEPENRFAQQFPAWHFEQFSPRPGKSCRTPDSYRFPNNEISQPFRDSATRISRIDPGLRLEIFGEPYLRFERTRRSSRYREILLYLLPGLRNTQFARLAAKNE